MTAVEAEALKETAEQQPEGQEAGSEPSKRRRSPRSTPSVRKRSRRSPGPSKRYTNRTSRKNWSSSRTRDRRRAEEEEGREAPQEDRGRGDRRGKDQRERAVLKRKVVIREEDLYAARRQRGKTIPFRKGGRDRREERAEDEKAGGEAGQEGRQDLGSGPGWRARKEAERQGVGRDSETPPPGHHDKRQPGDRLRYGVPGGRRVRL